MSLFSNKTKNLKATDPILTIQNHAKEMKKTADDVIDGTVGMLFNEDKEIYVYKTLEKSFEKAKIKDSAPYTYLNGGPEFQESVLNWVFDESDIASSFHKAVYATTGASQAINNILSVYTNKDEEILIPKYYWLAYNNIVADSEGVKVFYEIFDENNNFNFEKFKLLADSSIKKQNKLIALFNDPCGNPTSFSLNDNDWEKLIELFNSYSAKDINVVLLLDIAYFDFNNLTYQENRSFFNKFKKLEKNVVLNIIFSASKSFSMYGFRLGSHITLTKNEWIIEEHKKAVNFLVRGRYSNPTNFSIKLFNTIVNEYKNEHIEEIRKSKEMLFKRAKAFIENAEKYNLPMIRYDGGFFISLKYKNEFVVEELMKNHIYVTTMNDIIRIAISSVSLSEVERLVKYIKEYS